MSKRGASILVVDDEQEIVRALQHSLSALGYRVFAASSGEEALEAVSRYRPDLLLLDLLLPGISGQEVTRRLRETSNVPIIVLSAKEAERDKVEALNLGADDYVSKPFGMDEVLARVQVALRHLAQVKAGAEPRFRSGPLEVDFAARRVLLGGRDVQVTPTEYELLKVLIVHRGKLLTHQMLLQEVWGAEAYARRHSLHVYIAHLRQKIEPDSELPRFVITIPGVGYRFHDDGESS